MCFKNRLVDNWIGAALIGGFALSLGSCSTMQTRNLNVRDDQNIPTRAIDEQRMGLHYSVPKGILRLQISKEENGPVTTTITTEYFGDPDHNFTMKPLPSGFANDTFTITVNEKRLLSSINNTHDDRTGQIIENLAQFVAEANKLRLGPFGAALDSGDLPPEFSYDVRIDPFQSSRSVSDLLGNLFSYSIKPLTFDGKERLYQQLAQVPTKSDRLYFRNPMPYLVTIRPKSSTSKYRYSNVVMLPNRAPITSVDLKRSLFVNRVNTLGFTNGMLTSWNITKPSELEGLSSLPVRLLRIFVGGNPDTPATPASVLAQQKAEVDAQNNLLDSLATLQNKKKALAPPATGGGNEDNGADPTKTTTPIAPDPDPFADAADSATTPTPSGQGGVDSTLVESKAEEEKEKEE